MIKAKLTITAFMIGALIMVVELLGSRIISPYLGSTILTWTALIGVMLVFLSLGYYWGGKLSRNASMGILSLIILGSGYSIMLVAIFKDVVLTWISSMPISEELKVVYAASAIFGISSLLFGSVSPIVFKLSVDKIEEVGEKSGYLWAVSTLGSIVGTFATGFWLLPNIGNLKLMYITSLILSSLSIFLTSKRFITFKILLFILSVIGLMTGWHIERKDENIITDIETASHRVMIKKEGDLKMMYIDGSASSILVEGEVELPFTYYYKYYDLMFWNRKDIKKVVMIGGAGMTYPRYLTRKYPDIELTVVEIDPEMTKIAEEHFDYESSKNVKIDNRDGRVFLAQSKTKYDAILIDAFQGLTLPFHLMTKEALVTTKNRLNDGGVVITNIVGAFEGKNSQLFRSVLTTFKSVFEDTKVFAVRGPDDKKRIQNLVVLASNSRLSSESKIESSEESKYIENLISRNIAPGHLLSDDWAPVDYWSYKQEKRETHPTHNMESFICEAVTFYKKIFFNERNLNNRLLADLPKSYLCQLDKNQ